MKAESGRIEFATLLVAAPGGAVLLRVPREASVELGTRGRIALKGTINGKPLDAPFAPDGAGSHVATFTQQQLNGLGLRPGDKVRIVLQRGVAELPFEPPADLVKAIARHVNAKAAWDRFTHPQKRAWVEWLAKITRAEERPRRIEEALSRIALGKSP